MPVVVMARVPMVRMAKVMMPVDVVLARLPFFMILLQTYGLILDVVELGSELTCCPSRALAICAGSVDQKHMKACISSALA